MPMDMSFLVAKAFVVHFPWTGCGRYRFRSQTHFVEESARLFRWHQENFRRVPLGEQNAIAAIELRVAKDHVAGGQLGHEIRKIACFDSRDEPANAAGCGWLFSGHQADSPGLEPA